MENEIRMTKLASCAGCGAKVGAGTLAKLLKGLPSVYDERLLVGYDTSDDACVYKISDELVLVETLDFFPPIVDDPFMFGQIAAANAISDIYAMGAQPKLALNIMAVSPQMPDEAVREVLRGGYTKAAEAGVIISGGHTIRDPEPKYGLSVTGFAHPDKIRLNCTPRAGDVLILTKALGTGIISTANKADMVSEETYAKAVARDRRDRKRERAAPAGGPLACRDRHPPGGYVPQPQFCRALQRERAERHARDDGRALRSPDLRRTAARRGGKGRARAARGAHR